MSSDTPAKKQRKAKRIKMTLPIKVECKEIPDGTWQEVTRTNDVSPIGAGFHLKNKVDVGRMLMLLVPMPQKLRQYDYSDTQYKVYGLVRHCVDTGENFHVGVAFVGKNPPVSYLENPGCLYNVIDPEDSGLWKTKELDVYQSGSEEGDLFQQIRKHERHAIPLNIYIGKVNDQGQVEGGEASVTENISQGGAAVFTTLDVKEGDVMMIATEDKNVMLRGIVRNRRIGEDGITRLGLEFVHGEFPLEALGLVEEETSVLA